ncbi:MAG: hemerythrin family protein [Rhodocyclaceae bacterium]|nr:hemerythrin family protein [Rhodocyclaceae bacterium]
MDAKAPQDPHLDHGIQDALFRGLLAVLNSGQDASEMLAAVQNFSLRHFEAEEHLMARHGYPDTPAHRAEHRRLLGEVQAMCTRDPADPALADVVAGVMAQMRTHIDEVDKRLADYLRAQEAGAHRGTSD